MVRNTTSKCQRLIAEGKRNPVAPLSTPLTLFILILFFSLVSFFLVFYAKICVSQQLISYGQSGATLPTRSSPPKIHRYTSSQTLARFPVDRDKVGQEHDSMIRTSRLRQGYPLRQTDKLSNLPGTKTYYLIQSASTHDYESNPRNSYAM